MSAFGHSTHTGLGNNGFEVSLNYITGVPDPNHLTCSSTLKLAFKSLLKRDASTKEKSIAAMLGYIKTNCDELDDDLVIISWVQLYPKLAIDDSKKVRSFSHQIQATFVKSLGKKYAKYLKDTIGAWLAGLFDSDRSVAKVCRDSLNIAFDNNQEKIANIWKIFVQQILQYAYQILAFETKDTISDERFASKDESETKFIRVVQAANLLLVQAMNVLNSIDPDDNLTTLVQSIYEQELLQTCFVSTDFNLKKSAFMTFKALVTSKHVDSLITKSLYKGLAKSMIKGIKFDSKINTLLYGTCLISILDTVVCVTKYDASFWLNIKKADEKLISLLKYGSLNSEPIYYDVVYKLLNTLPEEIFTFNDLKKVELFLQTIIASVQSEKTLPFMEKGWKAIINMIETTQKSNELSDSVVDTFTAALIHLLDSPRTLSPILVSLMHNIQVFFNNDKDTLLDINSAIMDALPDKDIVFPEYKDYKIKNTRIFVESFVNILISNKSDLSEVLLANAIESVAEQVSEIPFLAFDIVDIFIKKDMAEFDNSIHDFIMDLPNYINKDFIDIPLHTLKLYTHSKSATESKINPLVNQMYKKLEEMNQVDGLLKVITDLKKFSIHDAKDLSDHLVQNSRSLSPDSTLSNDSLYAFLTPTILGNLFEIENFDKFVSNCLKNYKNEVFVEFSIQEPKFLYKLFSAVLTENAAESSLYPAVVSLGKKLEENINTNENFAAAYAEAVFTAVSEFDADVTPLVKIISSSAADVLINKNLSSDLSSISKQHPQNLLSVANSLNLGVYFFVGSYESKEAINFKIARKTLNKTSFLVSLIKTINVESTSNVNDLLLFAEYASDVLFFDSSFPAVLQRKFVEFQSQTRDLMFKLLDLVSYSDLVESLSSKTSKCSELEGILDHLTGENKLLSYYSHRIIGKILVKKIEYVTSKEFEKIDLKSFLSHPALLFVIIHSAKKFLTSRHLEFVRTSVLSALISIRKPSDILEQGLHNLVLLNCFMELDLDFEVPKDFSLFTPQRFMMLLNTLPNWLETEIAFDEDFKYNRIALVQFVHHYLTAVHGVCDSNYPSDFVEKVFQLATRLVSENINLINSEDEISIDLLFDTLKLYLLLTKYKGEIETWNTDLQDIENEILEIFFKFAEIEYVNRPTQLLCSTFGYIFQKNFKTGIFSTHYDKLYDLMKSKTVEIQRIGATILHKMIPQIQDTLVVEFTLSKKKVNEEGESGIKLPQTLIEITKEPLADYIEYEPEWKVYQYIWSWYLIMDHFKNITQQMRQDYISDLGDTKIGEFLNFIFSEIDMAKFKLHEDEVNYVKAYSFDDHNALTYEEEIEKLLVNLVYEIMDNIGGTFAQQWFQSIKNRQVQSNIEKFISKYISPPLINDILSSLSNKTTIEENDFKININRKINEIKCRYDIDEQTMEISILLPPNYPLAQIAVNGVSRIGVDEKKWKSWIMSAQYVINFQNGSILDSIKHFKDNVSANFENYEDCAICYSILNAVDHSTPNKICATCKHNFHSACLYRWFKSSGASTCPLCRSKFNFKKHS